jgi:hypothetical protein
MLTEIDREEVSRGVIEGLEGQAIAARIGRSPYRKSSPPEGPNCQTPIDG